MLTRKPRKGDKIRWPDWKPGRVGTVIVTPHDEICWFSEPGKHDSTFIWKFTDQLNNEVEIVEDGPSDLGTSSEDALRRLVAGRPTEQLREGKTFDTTRLVESELFQGRGGPQGGLFGGDE